MPTTRSSWLHTGYNPITVVIYLLLQLTEDTPDNVSGLKSSKTTKTEVVATNKRTSITASFHLVNYFLPRMTR